MWPSMAQSQPINRGFGDWTEDDSVDLSLDLTPAPESNVPRNELERWLQEDPELCSLHNTTGADLWSLNDDDLYASSSALTSQTSGFDDDFTAFVSAPSPGVISLCDSEELSFDDDKLLPLHTGASYSSLGSVSDFECQGATEENGCFDHEGQPENAAQISRPTSRQSRLRIGASASAQNAPFHGLNTGPDNEGLDLTHVLSALEGMKAEIASMDDEAERRKAAAKVAVDLVCVLGNPGENEA
jgi:hypothetical protein